MIALNIIYGIIILFLCFYLSLFVFETIQLKRNPRPRFIESKTCRFKELNVVKTQIFGQILAR